MSIKGQKDSQSGDISPNRKYRRKRKGRVHHQPLPGLTHQTLTERKGSRGSGAAAPGGTPGSALPWGPVFRLLEQWQWAKKKREQRPHEVTRDQQA